MTKITIRMNGRPAAPWQMYAGNAKVSAHRTQAAARKAGEKWVRKQAATPKKRGKKATSKGHIRWKGKRPYVYQSIREGGAVKSVYYGTYEKWRQNHPKGSWVDFSTRCTMWQMDILDDLDQAARGHVWKS